MPFVVLVFIVWECDFYNKVEMETHSMPPGGHHDMASYDSTW